MRFNLVDDGLCLEGEVIRPPLYRGDTAYHHVENTVPRFFGVKHGDIIGLSRPPSSGYSFVVLVRFDPKEFRNPFMPKSIVLLAG